MSEEEEMKWAPLIHLSAFLGFIFPFGNIVAPLAVWIYKKTELPYVDSQGKEALNFQISITIYIIIASLLSLVLIGIPVLIGLFVLWLVMVIKAALRTSEGKEFTYPITVRFLK